MSKAAAVRAEEEYFREHVRPSTWEISRRKIGPNGERTPVSRGKSSYPGNSPHRASSNISAAPKTFCEMFDDVVGRFLDDIIEL